MSKGHAGVAVYATLAECGFFDKEELRKYYSDGSVYSGHVSHKGVCWVLNFQRAVWDMDWELLPVWHCLLCAGTRAIVFSLF